MGGRWNLVLQHKPDDVPHEEHESVLGRNAEVFPINGDLEGEQTAVGGPIKRGYLLLHLAVAEL